nr:hypothetical protein [Pantoea agglomerans]
MRSADYSSAVHKVTAFAYSIQPDGNFVTHVNISLAAIGYVSRSNALEDGSDSSIVADSGFQYTVFPSWLFHRL